MTGGNEPSTVRASADRHLARRRAGLALLIWLAAVFGGCAQQPTGSALPAIIANAQAGVLSLSDGSSAFGTGFVVAPGLIATNAHLTAAKPLLVRLSDGRRLTAMVVSTDQQSDLALLRIADTNLPVLPRRPDAPLVGETVIALGNPFGLGITASRGIVSAQGRSIGKAHRLQTDAAINPGNSGGPLIDTAGRVVGIVSARAAVGSGVGFAATVPALETLLNAALKGAVPDPPSFESPLQ